MEFGVHLPIAGFGRDAAPSGSTMIECAEAAEGLGYGTLCANDHIVFSVPWTDGLVALSVAATRTRSIRLMTTASLVVVRGAAPLASAACAIADVSGGRLTVCLTAGSTPSDYEAVGIPFEERWSRFDREVKSFKSHIERGKVDLPVWIASWGSEPGLRRVARLGDGWLASAYHATPDHFASALAYLNEQLTLAGKDPTRFPNAVATAYTYITDDHDRAEAVLRTLVSPRQAPADLRDRMLIGPARDCIEKLQGLEAAGVDQVFVWPVADEVRQLEQFAKEVAPHFAERSLARS
jgi:alkanesulfonate monooxygenase SsuD/methylene tetrahydromethanopterin reductase-like flavin-dependent oxidoreductase (luciferase family)